MLEQTLCEGNYIAIYTVSGLYIWAMIDNWYQDTNDRERANSYRC
jgi:hypothetical protein